MYKKCVQKRTFSVHSNHHSPVIIMVSQGVCEREVMVLGEGEGRREGEARRGRTEWAENEIGLGETIQGMPEHILH